MSNQKTKSFVKQKRSQQAHGGSSNAAQESSTSSNTLPQTSTPCTTSLSDLSETSTGRTFTCLCFPADGSPLHLVEARMGAGQFKPKHGGVKEPDLSEHLKGDSSKHDMQAIIVRDTYPFGINTAYWSYYSIDPNLPANKSLLSFPMVKSAIANSTATGQKFEDRYFYRGDYFLVRLEDETDRTDFEARGQSIHPRLIPRLREIIEIFIAHNWREEFLEKQVQRDVEMGIKGYLRSSRVGTYE
ncbi:hypothetical protein BZA77DRAFT_302256 [Pyronema omphalodes]|nr:hypothetical protein BZA77DRAFT_302256 [Pyronema omphalodes]